MGLVSSSIPNLLNGVSQQPAPLRQPTQAEIQENALSDVADGLKKRPNTDHTGNFPVLNNESTASYIDSDTTFFQYFEWLGETKCFIAYYVPAYTVGGTTINERTHYRIINVGKSNTDLTTDDSLTFSFQGTVHTGTFLVFNPASSLANFNISNYLFTNNPKRDLQLLITDTDILILNRSVVPTISSTLTSSGTLNSTQYNSFSDLPDGAGANAVVGNTYKIIGAATSAFDAYYVKALSANTYEETLRPNQNYSLNLAKMPIRLTWNQNLWSIDEIPWGTRTCGDSDSAPFPSFASNYEVATGSDVFYTKIESLFFFKNRLGILSGENVILSEAGNYYNFFPKTVTTLLDDAPIDVSLKYTDGAALKHAVVFNDSLTIFSDKKQFKVETNGTLTQSNISVVPSTDFDSNSAIPPVSAQNVLYFASTKGGFTSIKEYFVEADTVRSDALELTAHVPKYIPSDIKQLVTSQSNDLIFALTDSGRVFVYKYFTDGEQKLQSSWSEWKFPLVAKVNAIYSVGDYIHFLNKTDSDSLLNTSVINLKRPLDNVQVRNEEGSLEYITTLLDGKQIITATSYSATTGATTIDLPLGFRSIPVTNHTVIINTITGEVLDWYTDSNSGVVVGSSTLVGNVKVKGHHTGAILQIGYKYDLKYRLSPQYIRENNGQQTVQSGRLQLKTMRVGFEDTGYFKVEVTPKNRETFTYEYTGLVVNQVGSTVGSASLSDGTFRFPVMSRNDSVTIEIKSDSFLPCSFQTIEWEGFYTIRSRRI